MTHPLIIPILDSVAAEYGVPRERIMARDKRPSIATARHEAILRATEAWPDKSAGEIAALFNLDRTTVIHARRKAQERRMENAR